MENAPHDGYFPAGSEESDALVALENASVYRIGTLTLMDPAAGTADDVALVGRIGDTLCFVLTDDATAKLGETEFALLLPTECLVVDVAGGRSTADGGTARGADQIPRPNRKVGAAGGAAARLRLEDDVPRGQRHLVADGERRRRRRRVQNRGVRREEEGGGDRDDERDGGEGAPPRTRTVSEKTHRVVAAVSDKITDVLGGKVGDATTAKETDSTFEKRGRALLLASALSYAERSSGASEGYETMVAPAKGQATAYVAARYGAEAAELARHTAGAAANFGRAALTAQRVVNAKGLAECAAKRRAAEGIRSAVR